MAADAVACLVLFALVSTIVLGPDWRTGWAASTDSDGLIPAIAYTIAWVGVSWLVGLYRVQSHWTFLGDLRQVLRLGALMASGTIIAIWALNLDEVSRPLIVSLFLGQMAVTFLSRAVIRKGFGWFRAQGYATRKLIVLGTGTAARSFSDLMALHPSLGIDIIGYLRPDDRPPIVDGPLLGRPEDLQRIFHTQVVDEVAICLPVSDWGYIEPVTSLCREEGKAVRIPLNDIGLAWFTGNIEDLDGVPMLSHVQVPDQAVSMIAKRMLDIGLSLVSLVLLSPLFLTVSAALLFTEGGPVFFRQVRVGLHGRPFTIIKFRTMVPDAEERYAEVVAMSDTQGAAFKMTNDPRITRLGSLLRKTSIDELPQLWNVLRGEMSLVGPRPAPPREVAEYDVWHRRRLSMKPGITGLWQVEARRDESFDRRAMLDLRYIDGWSVWLDMKIIAKTVPALIQGR